VLYDIQITLLPHPFNGLFSRTTWASRCQKGKTSLDLNGAKDDRVLRCGDISWTICKLSAPHYRQITTPTPHHSIFTCRMLFLMPNQQCQSTRGKSAECKLYDIQTSCKCKTAGQLTHTVPLARNVYHRVRTGWQAGQQARWLSVSCRCD